MNNKMVRFLTSIGIDNVERFDLDFDVVARNPFDHNQVDMIIVKETPWNSELLFEFYDGLKIIGYPYDIKFSYRQKPSIYNAIELFQDWYRTTFRVPTNLFPEIDIDTITFTFSSEEEKENEANTLKLFKEFLQFINYPFDVNFKIIEKAVEGPKISERKLANLAKKAEDVSEETIVESGSEQDSYYKNTQEVIEEEAESYVETYQEENKKLLEKNQKKMEAERKTYSRKNAWRDKLPYKVFEDLSKIDEKSGNVDITGELFGIDKVRTIRGGLSLLTFGVGYKGTAISLKAIENENMSSDFIASLANGMYAHVKGFAEKDSYTNQLLVNVVSIDLLPPPPMREDHYEGDKRVELHLHSKMSVMDGVASITDYVKLAKNMGHKAIGITDHGVTQGFPEAQTAAGDNGIKMLYGSELYMVNDELPFALNPAEIPLNKAKYVVFDLETTGLSIRYDRITEFGAVIFEHGSIVKSVDLFINPEIPIPLMIQQKTRITDDMVRNKPTIEQTIDEILNIFDGAILVSHNIAFDVGFINEALRRMGREPLHHPMIDTLSLSRYLFPESSAHRLGNLSRNLGITSYNEDDAHRADYDARVLNEVWLAMLNKLTAGNYEMKHSELAQIKSSEEMLRHMRADHVIAYARNKEGLHALYELISMSHITYLADVPKTPKREIAAHRENLLIGSACFNGEIFDLARTRSKKDLVSAVKFYDYIEIQPLPNYSHLIDVGTISDKDELIRILKDIVEAADEAGVMVCATGDAHYLDPEDKIIRDIYISAKAVGNKPHPLSRNKKGPSPDQHFRSTEEMMELFVPVFGEERAKEFVITNTNKVADMIEEFNPIQKELHAPVIEGSPELLTNACYETARSLYGDDLPEIIHTRLQTELDGIINNGYSVTYYIAHQIVDRAHSDGYMVGSRGSVGSSLAATMYGITEVNPLPPHYRCPNCKHFETVEDPEIQSGYDLPDKFCPKCGTKMVGDGQNIPFQTFLGFNAEKIPDIDLNFPSDYQWKAFNLTKEFFGEYNVFRAGTIEKVAEKTAFGYVRGYYESKNIDPNSIPSPVIAYFASKAVDVKRTTGQHAGGVMVLPKGLSIYDFTPIQYPADDKESTWLTTHFDYRALHDALLKLDLLGHVDPLALKMMSEMTGIDVKTIPLNDSKVISLFTTDKALERDANFLNVKTGASGLPEFGTDTCQQILISTQPKSFADLVVVAGLAHGTDVWSNNAEELIKNKTCTIKEVIGCRDDIMTYLIRKGLPNKVAFSIMEDVRKGKGKFKAKEKEYVPLMKAHGVPDWYIDSCYKIKYMFPKAHAVAYTTMAVRVGYFKLYHPLEFYAVWFTARSKAYDINAMLGGREAIYNRYNEIKRKSTTKGEKATPKEKDIFKMLIVAIEMEERGITFANIDLYKSQATQFIVDHEKRQLIPPFIVLDGLGESAAESVVEARKNGAFSSQEDLLSRTKLSQTNVKDMVDIGALQGLGESDQMSLFEFGLEFGD